MHLFLNPSKLNKALIKPMHRKPTLNDIFIKLTNVFYMTIADTNSGYHNLILDKKSSYLTTFSYQCGRYRFTRLHFGVVPMGHMFQQESIKFSMACQMYLAWQMTF